MPVAVSWRLPPELTDGFGGVIVIDDNVAGVTVRVEDPETAPELALAVQLPVPTAFTIAAALTVHTPLAFDDQATELVTSWLLPSVRTALAASCKPVPLAKFAVAGDT